MTEEEKKTLIDIRERLVRIETILASQNYQAVEATATDAKVLSMKNSKDIEELQSYVKWFVLAVMGAFVTSICTIIFK